MYILIENEESLNTQKFKEEILAYGDVNFFNGKEFIKINCTHKDVKKANKFNCILLECKFIYKRVFL